MQCKVFVGLRGCASNLSRWRFLKQSSQNPANDKMGSANYIVCIYTHICVYVSVCVYRCPPLGYLEPQRIMALQDPDYYASNCSKAACLAHVPLWGIGMRVVSSMLSTGSSDATRSRHQTSQKCNKRMIIMSKDGRDDVQLHLSRSSCHAKDKLPRVEQGSSQEYGALDMDSSRPGCLFQ